jgi:hypothetical protein
MDAVVVRWKARAADKVMCIGMWPWEQQQSKSPLVDKTKNEHEGATPKTKWKYIGYL